MPTALTIAGSDSGGGAGIQADLKTFAAHDVHGTCAVTAVTAQTAAGVTAIQTISPQVVAAQIDAALHDFEVGAIKTGMLASGSIARVVCDLLDAHSGIPVVVDPVILSTSGARLLDEDGVAVVRDRLLPRARIVTPNRMEAEVLTGARIGSPAAAARAAATLRALGADAVVITGGHFEGPDAVDLLDDGAAVVALSGPRLVSRATHGTGCTFAAAIAAGLARGAALADAVSGAKHYAAEAIRQARPGNGPGLLNHFWNK